MLPAESNRRLSAKEPLTSPYQCCMQIPAAYIMLPAEFSLGCILQGRSSRQVVKVVYLDSLRYASS